MGHCLLFINCLSRQDVVILGGAGFSYPVSDCLELFLSLLGAGSPGKLSSVSSPSETLEAEWEDQGAPSSLGKFSSFSSALPLEGSVLPIVADPQLVQQLLPHPL